eukprot:scaffold67643_cov58-Phaeocystis_antarctica.AAC.3
MEMITKELAVDMNEDGTDTVYTTGDGKATPFLPADEMMPVVCELHAENKRLWKFCFIVLCDLAAIIVMHDYKLVLLLLVLKNGGPSISIEVEASPTITVSPINTNTASPIKGEPTMQNAASPTFKQMLEVGLHWLPKVPVDARYKARRGGDERMILEHMAVQDLIPH